MTEENKDIKIETDMQQFERICEKVGIPTSNISFKAASLEQVYNLFKGIKKALAKEAELDLSLTKTYSRLVKELENNNIGWDGYVLDMPATEPVLGVSVERSEAPVLDPKLIERLEAVVSRLESSSKQAPLTKNRNHHVEKSYSKLVVSKDKDRMSIVVRNAVKKLFCRRKGFLKIKEISELTNIPIGTIYRHIDWLVDQGLIKRVKVGNGGVKAYVKA